MATLRNKKKIGENFKFSEEFMQSSLDFFFSINSIKYNLDNLYVFDWESDKLLETKSGYIYEFEIKISKSDFKNDFKNKKEKHIILENNTGFLGTTQYLPKYYRLLEQYAKRGTTALDTFHKYADNNPYYLISGHKRPNYFYYAVPTDLIKEDEVPSYAGLIYINEFGTIKIIKKAPCLHKEKYTDDQLNLGEKFYYNMDKYRKKFLNELSANEYLRETIKMENDKNNQEMSYKELKENYDYIKESLDDLIIDNEKQRKLSDGLIKDLHNEHRLRHGLISEIKRYNKEFDYSVFEKDVLGEYEN